MSNDNADVATAWLQALAASGVSVALRNGRLELRPATAYKSLSDEELLVLRHHRQAIKELVRAGISLDVVRDEPTIEKATPKPEPAPPQTCKFCNRSPCIGEGHELYDLLHPLSERQRVERAWAQRDKDIYERETRERFGIPPTRW